MTKPKTKDQLQKRGRKSLFRQYILIAKAAARFGATEDEIADELNIYTRNFGGLKTSVSTPVVHPMKREERSKHLSSDATRESRTAKNQFALQRQMNGG